MNSVGLGVTEQPFAEYDDVERETRLSVAMTSHEGQHPANIDQLLAQLLSVDAAVTLRIEAASRMADSVDARVPEAFLQVLAEDVEPRLLMHVINILARKRFGVAVLPLMDLALATGHSAIEKADAKFTTSDVGIRVRVTAIQALGRMGDDRALVPLMGILGNGRENYRLRLAAAEGLGRLGDAQAVNPLLGIVSDEGESSQFLKESAVKALGMLGDMRALEPLLDMFESRKGLRSKFAFLKEQLVEAIGRLGPRHNRAMQALLESLEDEMPTVRMSAIESLAETGDTACIEPLKKCLFDAEDDVAIAAGSALYQLGGEALIRELLAQQENLPRFIRQELESYVP